jgi:hypothetical protein
MDWRIATAPDKLRSAVASLTQHGVPISGPVAAAAKELERVASLKPADVTPQDLANMFADPKAKAAELITLASTVATLGSRRDAWSAAFNSAGYVGIRAVAAEVGDIVEALRPAAEGHLDIIRWYAQEGSPDVSALVREHRTDDAQKAATAPLAHADWQALVKVRRDLSGRSFDWSKAGTWSNPEAVRESMAFKKGLVGLDFICTAIRAGGQLWWPSLAPAAELSARLIDAEEAAQGVTNREDRMQRQSAL